MLGCPLVTDGDCFLLYRFQLNAGIDVTATSPSTATWFGSWTADRVAEPGPFMFLPLELSGDVLSKYLY
jgi:hypothetical protein